MNRRSLTTLLFLLVATITGKAYAASGTVTGGLFFWQAQGNFCPSTRDCTGSLYTQAQTQTWVGIPEVKIKLLNSSGSVIGSASSDLGGRYSIQWTTSGNLSNARTVMTIEHKDSRFRIRTASDGQLDYTAQFVNLVNGATQEQGNSGWGNASVPDRFLNVYHGAFRTWANSLSNSNRMASLFTGVKVLVDSTACPSSCADGPTKVINLDTGAPFSPQARIAHEMGHIASQINDGHKDVIIGNAGWYCFPSQTGNCNWALNTDEWGGAAFEEGLATFIGDLSLYNFNALAPHTCLAGVSGTGGNACANNTFNVETSPGFTSEHTVINITRYLWDIYDEPIDSATSNVGGCGGTFTDHLGRDLFEFMDTLSNYTKGTGTRQHNDVWNPALNAFDELDGRRYHDFNWNFKNRGLPANTNSDIEICMNSGWPG